MGTTRGTPASRTPTPRSRAARPRSIRRSAGSAAARSRPKRPATSPPRISSTCSKATASRPAPTSMPWSPPPSGWRPSSGGLSKDSSTEPETSRLAVPLDRPDAVVAVGDPAIATGPAVHEVAPPVVGVDEVAARAAEEPVLPRMCREGDVPDDDVVAAASVDDVVAALREDHVALRRPDEHVVALRALEDAWTQARRHRSCGPPRRAPGRNPTGPEEDVPVPAITVRDVHVISGARLHLRVGVVDSDPDQLRPIRRERGSALSEPRRPRDDGNVRAIGLREREVVAAREDDLLSVGR